jgi:hypothetical protein
MASLKDLLSRRFTRRHLTKTSGISEIVLNDFFGEAPANTAPIVVTGVATSIDYRTVTLNGELTNMGGLPSVTVRFQYGIGNTNTSTATQVLNSTGPFSVSLTGLTPGTTYSFIAKAVNTVGEGTGTQGSFSTLAMQAPTVIVSSSGITETSVSLIANITNTGGHTSFGLSFQWGTSTSYGTTRAYGVINSTGTYTLQLGDELTAGTLYHFRADLQDISDYYSSDATFTTTVAQQQTGIPAQFNIGDAIIKSTKAQANIENTIVNLTKAQANINGTIVTIWQSGIGGTGGTETWEKYALTPATIVETATPYAVDIDMTDKPFCMSLSDLEIQSDGRILVTWYNEQDVPSVGQYWTGDLNTPVDGYFNSLYKVTSVSFNPGPGTFTINNIVINGQAASKGSYIEDVTSSAGTYPDNGVSGSFWYVKKVVVPATDTWNKYTLSATSNIDETLQNMTLPPTNQILIVLEFIPLTNGKMQITQAMPITVADLVPGYPFSTTATAIGQEVDIIYWCQDWIESENGNIDIAYSTITSVPCQGTFTGTVTDNSGSYPDNGEQNGFWYFRQRPYQYFIDFDKYQGNGDLTTEWGLRCGAQQSDYQIKDLDGGAYRGLVIAPMQEALLSYNLVDGVKEIEIVYKHKRNNVEPLNPFPYLCVSGNTIATVNGYTTDNPARSGIIKELTNGAISESTTFTGINYVVDEWYWTRFRKEGNVLKVKSWADYGQTEPETWTATLTLTSAQTDGIWSGLSQGIQTAYVLCAGFGLYGATAPTSQV